MKDKCVTCGVDSIFDLKEHIKFRIGYIRGVGQLCLECYDEIYFKSKTEKEMKNENGTMVRL
jgi:hypothetical protein